MMKRWGETMKNIIIKKASRRDYLALRALPLVVLLSSLIAIVGCSKSEDVAEQTTTDKNMAVEKNSTSSAMYSQLPSQKPSQELSREPSQKPSQQFSTRLRVPRIPPLTESGRTPEQIAMLADRPDYNLYKTLAHHVELYNRWTPLGRSLLNGSRLPARDREIIMLRMGWLCQAEYEWSQHARIATADDIGMTDEEVERIASDPNSDKWTPFEKTLMVMVDELRYDAMISDATWSALSERYDTQQIMDAFFTAAQYQLVSMVLNSTGIQLDPILKHRLPTGIPLPALAQKADSHRLSQPRVSPLSFDQLSEEQKTIIAPQVREDGSIFNLYATLIHHPTLYGPRYTFGSYLLRDSQLPADMRELLIMRTAWLIQAEYEWAHHVEFAKSAGLSDDKIAQIIVGAESSIWNEQERAVIQAADDLRREAFITHDTWQTLEKYFTTQQMVEIIFTVGGYTMTGLAINSLGIQVEEGYPSFPDL